MAANAAPDLPLLHVDHLLIGQVLANLVDDADAALAAGRRHLLGARCSRADDGLVELAVKDNGPGVPRPTRENVFQMFNRNGRRGPGRTGLAIAKAFVEAHGEHIWVEAAPAGGARLAFTMAAEACARGRWPTMAKVLVVDDDRSLLKALRIGLALAGDAVLVARRAEGMSQVAIGAPDMMVLDWGLPDLDGIEVCRRIREFSSADHRALGRWNEDRKIEALDGGRTTTSPSRSGWASSRPA